MSDFEIYTSTADEVHSGELGRRMRQFKYQFVGECGQVQPVWVSAKDASGGLVGGLRGFVFLHWLNGVLGRWPLVVCVRAECLDPRGERVLRRPRPAAVRARHFRRCVPPWPAQTFLVAGTSPCSGM